MTNPIVQLPMGDLFRPYEYDEDGNIKQRANTIDAAAAVAHAAMASRGPDVAAILMAENLRLQDEAAARG